MLFRYLFFSLLILVCFKSYSQDVDFHLNAHLLPGKNVLKVKRNFRDPYLWVLAQNNEVYRINSLTLVVEDYTNKFSAYSSTKFIDIAGRSKDTVFIACDATRVIEYKKGIIKVIGPTDGITTKVNSVGVEETRPYFSDPHSLLIGSDKGFYWYNVQNDKLTVYNTSVKSSKIYEATYRLLVYKDSAATYPDWDNRKYVPVIIMGESTVFQYFMSESATSGRTINTSYQAFASIYDYDILVSYTALFWGTKKGLFQVNGDESYFINRPYQHYLDGINVNKITSSFGLTAFGDGSWYGNQGLIKQTLLVGTDKGLYFTNSIYQKSAGTRQIDLFHYDALRNMVINDISVNTSHPDEPICDDGVWIAAADGLYLLKPDYGKYLTATSINAIQFKEQDAVVSEIEICSGEQATAIVNTNVYKGHTIQWYKDGAELSSESNTTLHITAPGNYSAVVYDPCENIHLTTNKLKVTVITSPTVTFNYPDKNFFCSGTTATFQVQSNSNYKYRWYKNGVLNGNTSNILNTTKNGKYKVEVSACSGVWVSSKEVEVKFINLPKPVIKTDKNAYCIGDQATLSIEVAADASYTINWLRDGVLIDNSTNKISLTTNLPGNYVVSISSNEITCLSNSQALLLAFNPFPTVNIQKVINTTLCDGQTVDLTATTSGGTIEWATGETSNTISVAKSGTYTATVISASGCEKSENIKVKFFPNPVLSLQDATLCQFTRQQITLNAPAGFTKYVWNGIQGQSSFNTGSLGKVELTVTDKNGCTASETINISSYCTDIKMANTFTPNNDGVNDKWIIEGLDNSATVKIYNRSGSLLFESHGYADPWDGTYKGSKLPAGTYYYIVNARNGTQVLSGWVLIMY